MTKSDKTPPPAKVKVAYPDGRARDVRFGARDVESKGEKQVKDKIEKGKDGKK